MLLTVNFEMPELLKNALNLTLNEVGLTEPLTVRIDNDKAHEILMQVLGAARFDKIRDEQTAKNKNQL